jgi:hypothetical protein
MTLKNRLKLYGLLLGVTFVLWCLYLLIFS